jgi:hypothetical protein
LKIAKFPSISGISLVYIHLTPKYAGVVMVFNENKKTNLGRPRRWFHLILIRCFPYFCAQFYVDRSVQGVSVIGRENIQELISFSVEVKAANLPQYLSATS